ncbi:MAG: glycoside hydrolase family 25 protein [Clostridia bacterium]|nr:glycoside hydrolase family 25 protein [Clostridia bacterium]
MSESQIAPTCDKEGYILRQCEDCGAEFKSDFTPAEGHDLSSSIFSPTCNDEGYTYYSCECGYSFKSDFVAPIAHTLRSELHEPDCVNEGYTLYSCECGYSYKSDFTEPKGHTTVQKTTAPRCEEQGYTTHSCLVCDYSYISDFTEPTGHTFTKKTTYATSFSDGHTLYSCGCGYDYTADIVLSEYIFHGAYLDNAGMRAQGIDVSKWNGTIDWEDIKAAGIDFVIIKVGSVYGIDPSFEENYRGAKAAGLDVGCYIYSYALTVEEALAEAEMMLEWIAGKQFEYPVYFDLEDSSQKSLDSALLTDMCIAFIEKLQSNGYFCGLYTNPNWLTNILEADRLTPYFDIWLARWTLSGEPNWSDSFGAHTGIWQYTDKGTVGAHTCAFDMNISYKDYPRLIKDWGYNGY